MSDTKHYIKAKITSGGDVPLDPTVLVDLVKYDETNKKFYMYDSNGKLVQMTNFPVSSKKVNTDITIIPTTDFDWYNVKNDDYYTPYTGEKLSSGLYYAYRPVIPYTSSSGISTVTVDMRLLFTLPSWLDISGTDLSRTTSTLNFVTKDYTMPAWSERYTSNSKEYYRYSSGDVGLYTTTSKKSSKTNLSFSVTSHEILPNKELYVYGTLSIKPTGESSYSGWSNCGYTISKNTIFSVIDSISIHIETTY